MSPIKNYIRLINKLDKRIGTVVSWFTTLLVLVVCYDVLTRYLLKESSVAVQEIEWHLFSIIFLMGASFTLRSEKHVRVDLFYSRLSPKRKALINLLGTLILLIPFCLLVIYSSKDFVINSFNIGESSPNPGGLPARYILKAILPVSFFLILLQGIAQLFESFLVLINNPSEKD